MNRDERSGGSRRRKTRLGWALWAAVALLYLLHNDLWLWDDASLVLGLPVGFLYHLVYCGVAALLMAALVRWDWPRARETTASQETPGSQEKPGARPTPGNDDGS